MQSDREKYEILLSLIYSKIPWSKINCSNAWEFWTKRLRSSANSATISEQIDRLCRYFQINSIDETIHEYTKELDKNSSFLLNECSRECAPIAMSAVVISKSRKK